ncbi:MAG: 50S ribosomal protein L15 [Planctomycetes bacterium]|nr:50S ribosomal protein L15 [Planctomycetota bacterium]
MTQLNAPHRGKRPGRLRRCRGPGSGRGKTGGKGYNGAKARSGFKLRLGFEGGGMPLIRKLPKRGFNNAVFHKEYAVLNVGDLEKAFESGAAVGPDEFLAKGLINRMMDGAKVLAKGEVKKKLKVSAHAFSEGARKIIEAAGGSVHIVER